MNGIHNSPEFVSNEPLEQNTPLHRMDKKLDEEASSTMVLLAGIAFMVLYVSFFYSLTFIG